MYTSRETIVTYMCTYIQPDNLDFTHVNTQDTHTGAHSFSKNRKKKWTLWNDSSGTQKEERKRCWDFTFLF
uniref:Uncharacterized protein n=1 Tax=Anguilla anguilla TaxID=7936 RepID=A0A0E9R115_ANGAN